MSQGMKGQNDVYKFVWDFAKHGGTKDANIELGLLPLNFIIKRVDVVCVTPLVGASGTIDVGHSTTPSLVLNDEAITSFDTAGKNQSADIHDAAAATTTALRTIVLLINTTNQTAGVLHIYVEGFVPDLSTGVVPDTTY